MPARPQVSIRLATDGKAQVQRDFDEIGTSGDAAAQRIARAFERDSAAAEAAVDRLNRTAQRLSAISQTPLQQTIGQSTSTGYGDPTGTARTSAAAMEQQFSQGEAAAKRLLASIDPLFAAQLRYNAAIEQTNLLEAQGVQIEGGYSAIRAGLKTQLNDQIALYGKHGEAVGNTRIAQMELMHVVRGSVDQFAAGANPMQIFTMHLGMLGQAAALSGESMGKFGAFMSSGWGLALTVAVVALAPLISKLAEAGSGVDALVDKLKKEAEQQGLNDQAHKLFVHTLEGVEQVIRDVTKAYDDYEGKLKTSAQASLDHAKAALKDAEAMQAQARAALSNAAADQAGIISQAGLNGLGTNIGTPAGAALQAATDASKAAQADLDKSGADIARLNDQVDKWQSIVTVEKASESAVDRIRDRYKGLIEAARQHALAQHQVGNELDRQVRLLKEREDAEIKAANDNNRKPGKNAAGEMAFDAEIGRFFDIANRYRGDGEHQDKGVLQSFFREAQIAIDPEKVAWCAAFVNAVLASGGVHGTGSLAASSFLGFGKDDIHSPQRGDVVVVRSNGSPSGMHVGILDSVDNKTGAFSILGGNTRNGVNEATYSASNVLAVRRPETPSESFVTDQKAVDAISKAYAEQVGKEQEIDLIKGHQVTLVEQMVRGHGDLEQIIARTLPSLKAWEREYEQIIASQQEFKDFAGQELDNLFNPDNWKNFRDLGVRMLKELEAELIKLSLLNPLKNWLLGENNPTISALFKGIGSIAGALADGGGVNIGDSALTYSGPSLGDLAAGLPTMGSAIGSDYFPGGQTWVGEFGKELVTLPRGSKITPASESRRLAAANDRGIGSINMPIHIDATGADSAELARTRAELQQLKEEIPARVVEAYFEATSRNIIRTGR